MIRWSSSGTGARCHIRAINNPTRIRKLLAAEALRAALIQQTIPMQSSALTAIKPLVVVAELMTWRWPTWAIRARPFDQAIDA